MPMLEYDVRRIEIDDVDLSKSITNPFDPLLIVRDPYNSRIIKELYQIASENSFLSIYPFRWSSILTSKAKGTNTFDQSLSLELYIDVSSWLKLKARHWRSLQVAPPYTMWEALLCIHLHLYIIINYLMTSFDEHQAHENYLTHITQTTHSMGQYTKRN